MQWIRRATGRCGRLNRWRPARLLGAVVGMCALVGLGCGPSAPPLTADAMTQLAHSAESPERLGEKVYEGAVWPLTPSSTDPVYRYERRQRRLSGTLFASTHLTVEASGTPRRPVVLQRAVHSETYQLREYSEIHAQVGVSSQLRVLANGWIEMTRQRDSTADRRRLRVGAPVVVGPTLYGFARRQLKQMQVGDAVSLCFALPNELEAYEMSLRLVTKTGRRSVFEMTVAHPLLRWFVPAMGFGFNGDRVDFYRGRVPPRQLGIFSSSPLDAVVRYSYPSG